jgi:hypothetical protein
MPAHILLHDSSPQWWLSPDIWVVPGNDPSGLPGSPIAGLPAYLWTRVSNIGTAPANGTRVDFYWANPSAQVVVGVATKIGSAFVDLAPGETQDVLCLVPWIPVVVNGGHECVIAVAHAPNDTNPLPDPLPNGYSFEPPAHDQIAQLNLSVLLAARLAMPLILTVSAIGRVDKRVSLSIEFGEALDERKLLQMGLQHMHPVKQQCIEASLSLEPCHEQFDSRDTQHELAIHVKNGTSAPVYVSLRAESFPKDGYQLIHVVERSAERIIVNKIKHKNKTKEQGL